jgi:hypothetical protein
MTWGEKNLLLLAGLFVGLASQPAGAAMLVGAGSFCSPGGSDNLLHTLATQVLASADFSQPVTHAGTHPTRSGDSQNDRPAFRPPEGFLPAPATGCHSNSVSQSSGSGSTGPAVAGRISDVPPPRLWAALPSEAKTTLPTGPPFELLRPPQVG